MRKITIEEMRESLTFQLKERLCYDKFVFDNPIEVFLKSGQKLSCYEARQVDNGDIAFSVGIENFQDFYIYDISVLSIDSVDKILNAIPIPEHSFDIYANEELEKEENHICLASGNLLYPPTLVHAQEILNDIMPLPWERNESLGEMVFTYFPDETDRTRYLIAHFD